MLSKRLLDLRRSLALRLTLWYALIFTLTAAVAFLCFYLLITALIRERIDQDLLERSGAFGTVLSLRGMEALKQAAILEAQAAGEQSLFIRLLYPTGVVFSSSNMSYWQDIGIRSEYVRKLAREGQYTFETVTLAPRRDAVRVLYDRIGNGIVLQLGQSMANYTRLVDTFRKLFVTAMSGLLALAVAVGWFMARRALSGVETVTRTARRITGRDLKQRVPVKGTHDEIDRLALTFNAMLERIEALVNGMQEMSDSIAHDLKSPLTRIRGVAELAMTGDDTDLGGFRKMAGNTIEECDRLLEMINTMLMISKTEAGVARVRREDFDLAGVVADACELFDPLVAEAGIQLKLELPSCCRWHGDLHLIQRLIGNLLDNAVKYTPAGGEIRVVLRAEQDDDIVLVVQDSGIGITPEDLPRVFDRYFRSDPSRSKEGTGLGLSLVQAIVTAHGGRINAASVPGQGTTMTVTLPTA